MKALSRRLECLDKTLSDSPSRAGCVYSFVFAMHLASNNQLGIEKRKGLHRNSLGPESAPQCAPKELLHPQSLPNGLHTNLLGPGSAPG
eukprot:1155386-Pelagomonas_calceolata.AAC.6